MIALLKAHSLTVKDHFEAERFALNLSERQSTASITVGPRAPAITVNDWLRDEHGPGAGIVWRVKSIDTDYATESRTLNCEHLITELRDLVMFGEVTPATITGNKKATSCTAEQAARYVLKGQGDWTLGSMGFSKSAPYNFNGDDLLSALETISGSLLEAWWSYDFTSYPFKLNIRPKSTQVACEMRMDRNIRSLKKTVDKTRMFTRFYPIGKNNLKLGGGGYVEKNANLYGIISKVETDGEKASTAELKAWAEEKLNNHAEPLVTITITGLDLSEATGEPLDRLTLGTVCRVPLPEFETIITERITRLSWGDKLADPESVSITLANQVEDVASIVNRIQKAAGSGGRSAAKKAGEDHAWFVDTEDHVGMVAEAVAGPGADKDWSRVSSIFADGSGIHQRVTKTEGDLVVAEQRIETTETSWTNTVSAIGKDGKITVGSICLAINDSGDPEAVINAKKIYLLGQTIANTVTAELIQSKVNLMSNLRVNQLTVATALKFEGGDGCTITSSQAADILRNLRISKNGNNYTLQKITCGGGSWEDVGTFSRAITSWGVAGSSGKVKVTAQPQNQSKEVPVSISGGNTISANGQYLYDIYYEDDNGDDVKLPGTTKTITVAVHPNSMTLTRSKAGRTSGGLDVYYGQLYYWDDDDGSYMPAAAGNHYWYYSSTNRAGTNAVYY